jgi:hypothetical protein
MSNLPNRPLPEEVTELLAEVLYRLEQIDERLDRLEWRDALGELEEALQARRELLFALRRDEAGGSPT